MNRPLVSILIPFKDTAQFLTECMASITNQTYKNWEVIAINDHSTDHSYKIVEKFADKDGRIKIFNNKGKGIIMALRTAYGQSSGKFITRMDSDDIMKPDRLEYMIGSLLKFGTGHISIGQVKYFSTSGIGDGYARYEDWLNGLTAKGTNYNEMYKECVIPSPCWMVFREDLDACGAFEPNRYPEDYDLTFRFYEKGLKIIPCNKILLLWRDYDTRTSRTSEHYAHNYFLDIKLYYFLKLHVQEKKPLVVWGAGNKGKTIAKLLINKKIGFHWICDNPKKIGKEIYEKEMHSFTLLELLKQPQTIVTVANEEAQAVIKAYFSKLGQEPMRDYFFFC